jgi:alginate production protein
VRIRVRAPYLIGAALGCISSLPAQAQNPPAPAPAATAASDESLFGDGRVRPDKKKKFSINGRIALELQRLVNSDLDQGPGGNRTAFLPEIRFDVTYRPKKHIEMFASLELGTDFTREARQDTARNRIELREAYVLIDHSIARNVEFQFGRQRFKDRRQWLYDERLDAVRLAYDHQAWRVEVAYAREALLRKDVLHRDRSRRKVDNFLVRAEYQLAGDWYLSAYALKQEDRRPSNLSPVFVGVQSSGFMTPRIGHWLELSWQRGTAGTRKLRANAVDAGLIYRWPGRFQPAVFAGFARGSGGGNARTSHEFRQTGLQDNEDRITGIGNVHYYGELLDPDLSNLRILTLGAGIRPSASTSLEIVGHRYRQVKLNDNDVRGSPISPELNGDSKSIGSELDAIFAARLGRRFGLEAKLGWFRPGSGFDRRHHDDAYLAKVRLVKQF